MKVVIMGCGRAGAMIARALASEGHAVTILDTNVDHFRRLAESLGITMLMGDGTVSENLVKAGIDDADAFVAVEERDVRNALAAQKARFLYFVPKVVCHISDPVRNEMYHELGLETVSSVQVISSAVLNVLHR